MAKTLTKVTSLYDLRRRAGTDQRYVELALIAARNLGGDVQDLGEAMRWLGLNATETSERWVVAEINFVRDLVKGGA